MHPSRLRSDVGGHIFQERNHIVIGSFLNFENLGDRKSPASANRFGIRFRNQPELSHGLASQDLNFQPN